MIDNDIHGEGLHAGHEHEYSLRRWLTNMISSRTIRADCVAVACGVTGGRQRQALSASHLEDRPISLVVKGRGEEALTVDGM
jgi:hypothetical protein